MVIFLLKNGAKIDTKSTEGLSPLQKAVQNRHTETVKALLENGAEIGSSESEVLEILERAGPKEVLAIGCFNDNTIENFAQEGINYTLETKKITSDSANKIKHLDQYLGDAQKIPAISHHIYFTSEDNPKEIDAVSIQKTIDTIKRLSQEDSSWKHYIWTNNAKFIPVKLTELSNVEVHLISEMQDSLTYPELTQVLSGAKDKAGFVTASDIARIMVLEKGGVYFDLDYEVFEGRAGKLIDLTKAFDFFAGKEAPETTTNVARLIGNSILAAAPGHLVIKTALELIKRNFNQEQSDHIPEYVKFPCTESSAVAYKSGGVVITVAYYLAANNKTVDIVLPSEYLYNAAYAWSITPDSKCHKPGIKVALDENAIGADMFCGSWGFNLNSMNMIYHPKNLNTYFVQAAEFGYTKVVEYFFNKGAPVDATINGVTALCLAIQNGHVNTVKFLLEHGANTENKLSQGFFPIHVAGYNKRSEIVKILLEHKVNIETTMPDGSTPLYIAASVGDVDTVKLLLAAGANKNVIVNGLNVAQVAAKNGYNDIVQLLSGAQIEVHQTINLDDLLFFAAAAGNLTAVKQLIAQGAKVNALHSMGGTP